MAARLPAASAPEADRNQTRRPAPRFEAIEEGKHTGALGDEDRTTRDALARFEELGGKRAEPAPRPAAPASPRSPWLA